jgi:co-chaperonin GroES (HSP10)
LLDIYTIDDKTLRLVGPRVLVRIDPLPSESKGGVIFPGKSTDTSFQTGTVLAKANQKWNPKDPNRFIHYDVEVGDRILFYWMQKEIHTNIVLRGMFSDDIILVQPIDILLVFDAGDKERLE